MRINLYILFIIIVLSLAIHFFIPLRTYVQERLYTISSEIPISSPSGAMDPNQIYYNIARENMDVMNVHFGLLFEIASIILTILGIAVAAAVYFTSKKITEID